MKQEHELPSNPITPMLAALIDKASGAGTAETIWQLMQEFARQAIALDRQGRGEPFGYVLIENDKAVASFDEIPVDGHWDASAYTPVGMIGKPAEPVKVPSDAEIDQLAYEHCDDTDASGEQARFTSENAIIAFARALLARYGAAQPAEDRSLGIATLKDVDAMIRMLRAGEWAERVASTPMGRNLEAAITKLHAQPAASVTIDFDQIGRAGPFPFVDGRVSVPAITVMDLVRMARPAASVEHVGEVFTMEPLDGSGQVKSHALLTKPLPAGTKLYTAPVAARPSVQRNDRE